MCIRPSLLVLWLAALVQVANGQTPVTDSLRTKLHHASSGKERLPVLLALGQEQHSLNRDTAYQYALEAVILAAKSDTHTKSLAALYFAQSYIPWGWVDSSLAVLEPVLSSNPVTDPATRELHFRLYRQKAMLYGMRSQYKEALSLLYQLINDTEQYKDSVSAGANLNSIGSIAIARGLPAEALAWLYRALSLSTRDHRYITVSTAIYINLANACLLLNRNDSALFYLAKAIPVAKETANLSLLITALRVETAALVKMKELQKAERSLQQMLDVKAKINSINVTDDNLVMIDFYNNTGQFEKAIAYCKQCLLYGSSHDPAGSAAKMYTNAVTLRLPFYEALAKSYKIAGKTDLYRQTLEQIIQVKDSVFAAASAREIADIQTKYETQIRENSIIQQQRLDLTRKNYLFYGSLCLSALALLLGAVVFNNYRRRQKVKMKYALLEEKRMADEAVKKAEEKERVRIAADLHDNLGAYAASMASNLSYIQVDEKNEQTKNAFAELKNNSGAMVSELNDTIWALKKEMLSLTAISDRLKVFINRLRKSYPGINIDVKEEIISDRLLTAPQAFHLYRILQEGINNALKHSRGTNITITITAGDNWSIAVMDDGKGLPLATLPGKEGNGCRNMKERSKENGWNISWSASAPGGTLVMVWPAAN